MTERAGAFSARRIVVALESGCENRQALEVAADMAARMRAELHGIFVDDIHLLRLAALPFTRQTSLHSAGSLPIETNEIEAELRALASRARRSLQDVAARLRVPWSFETVRGDRSSVVAATQGTDVLVVETTTRPFGRHIRMPTEWSQIAISCERACVLTSPVRHGRGGILAIHDGSESGEHAVEAALALDGRHGAGLTVASVAPASEPALRHRLHEAGAANEIEPMTGAIGTELSRIIAKTGCELMILPIALVSEHRAELQALLAAPPCAVLLVN
jgi:nucleotide-binding universal stress UspA family protein